MIFDLVAGDRRLDLLDYGLQERNIEIGNPDGAGAALLFQFSSVSNMAGRFMFLAGQCTR